MAEYLPQPPRAWSRVQNDCTYPPQVGDPVQLIADNAFLQMMRKGNVLQHKHNSWRMSRREAYSRMARGFNGPLRNQTFATQSETYTDPNIRRWARVGARTIPYPNDAPGEPNNPAGPYAIIYNQYCDTLDLVDGGTLVCTPNPTDPCAPFADTSTSNYDDNDNNNNRITQLAVVCAPSTASDVPGPAVSLCWAPALDSWFPRERRQMSNSTNKFPINYQPWRSATRPLAPTLSLSNDSTTLQWSVIPSRCFPTTAYWLYRLGNTNPPSPTLVAVLPPTTTSFTVPPLVDDAAAAASFTLVNVSGAFSSLPSNVVTITTTSS